ncbi:MAG: MtnX-like HAD-IB family phosphatase [Dokdonella sp.]
MSDWTILCDFDGTVSVEDVTDSLLVRFARPGWQVLEDSWRSGQIGSRDCMAGQIALLDAQPAEIDEHLETMPIDRVFPEFVDAATLADVPLWIVSDGLDYAIRNVLDRHALGWLPIVANQLDRTAEGRWRLAFPFGNPSCSVNSGTCKCARAARARQTRPKVLLIGDGTSDFCVAEQADMVFAKHRLIEHCRAAGIPYVPITGFADAIDLLPALLAGDIAAHVHGGDAVSADRTQLPSSPTDSLDEQTSHA